jgi:hypothetical protein
MVSLLNIIEQLEDPDVRLEDNSEYKLDSHCLGVLYAHAVTSSGSSRSPSIGKRRNLRLEPEYESVLKKKFQHHSRRVLRDALADLCLRNYTAESLCEQFQAEDYDPTIFEEDSPEYVVAFLASEGKFSKIGNRLKLAARECEDRAISRGNPSNYPLRKEYDTIAEIFLEH